MFCGNCGKEMISNTRFCQFCGAEQTAVVISPASIPVSTPVAEPDDTTDTPDISSIPVSGTSIEPSVTSIPIEPSVTSMGVPADESIEAVDESAPAESSAATTETIAATVVGLPTPNAIPTSNMDRPEPAVYASPVKTEVPAQAVPTKTAARAVPQTEITIKSEEKRRPERKYTLGHIVMCLAAAAVMAITAGVFAGLYFSVI